jgi:hypothetical protein
MRFKITKQIVMVCGIFLITSTHYMHGQAGINTTTPGDGAMLDIYSQNKGILIPKVNIGDVTTIAPVVSAAEESLLVYNTNAATGKGFYYWTGAIWTRIGVNINGGLDWKITGNSGTTLSDPPALGDDFLGTIDDQDYIFRTNGIERMRLTYDSSTNDSFFGIGTDTPNNSLDVNGDIEVGGGSTRFDNGGENIYIRPFRNTWYTSVRNEPDPNDSHFFIGDNSRDTRATIAIDPVTEFVLIGNDDSDPVIEDILHVLDDQSETTTVRIDNDNSATAGIVHSSIELWKGATETAFFRHKNQEDILEIGNAISSGSINFHEGSKQAMQISRPALNLVTIYDDLRVDGVSKGAGTFKIDHPLDPTNKYLYHSFVESPDMMNMYDGMITTDSTGKATIKMPSYFEALNKQFQYQFTAIGVFSKVMIVKEISNNRFTIQSEVPNAKISWQVTGIRKDPYANKNRVIPEVEKENKGSLLHPNGEIPITASN